MHSAEGPGFSVQGPEIRHLGPAKHVVAGRIGAASQALAAFSFMQCAATFKVYVANDEKRYHHPLLLAACQSYFAANRS